MRATQLSFQQQQPKDLFLYSFAILHKMVKWTAETTGRMTDAQILCTVEIIFFFLSLNCHELNYVMYPVT